MRRLSTATLTAAVAFTGVGFGITPALADDAAAAPKITTEQTVMSFSASQQGTPGITSGMTADVTVRIANNGSLSLPGTQFVVKAPSGTTFAKNTFVQKSSRGDSLVLPGVLSDGGKTFTFDHTSYLIPDGVWQDNTFTLKSDAANDRTGAIDDGELLVTGGRAIDVGTRSAIAYTATPRAEQLSVPTILSGGSGSVKIQVNNPENITRPAGTSWVVVAPSGTKFKDNTFIWSTKSFSGVASGTLSSDGRILTYSDSATGGWPNDFLANEFTLVSDANNTRTGLVSDGSFQVTGGTGLPVGTTSKISYNAEIGVSVETPGEDTELEAADVEFAGKGAPNGTITITDGNGAPVASTTVKTDGTWTVKPANPLTPGHKVMTVSQNSNGTVTTAKVEFTVKAPVTARLDVATPARNGRVNAGTITFTGTSNPNAKIELRSIATGDPLGT
ncbi:Ig-like domain-containing protein, partial [Leucobacter iarius]|uniref:Ig-like domain-containing protein n=1 Tax=Leucobacter iarius TaxID=333963 RepID=UPI0031D5B19B